LLGAISSGGLVVQWQQQQEEKSPSLEIVRYQVRVFEGDGTKRKWREREENELGGQN
jgi:hypothetical protein